MESLSKSVLSRIFLVCAFLHSSVNLLFSSSPIVDWNNTTEYQTGSLVLVGQDSYIATQTVPANVSPPNTTYWTNLSEAASALNVPVESVPNVTTDTILDSLPGSSPGGSQDNQSSNSPQPLGDWINTIEYATGSLVLVGQNTYIATRTVPANISPPNSTYWTDLNVAANALDIPLESVPNISYETILASLPDSVPDSTYDFTTTYDNLPGGSLFAIPRGSVIPDGLVLKVGGEVFNLYGSPNHSGSTPNGDSVLSNPGLYGFYTESELNASKETSRLEGIEQGKSLVVSSPNLYNLHSDSQLEASIQIAKTEGHGEGVSSVISSPSAYNLVSKESYDQLQQSLEASSYSEFPWVVYDDLSGTNFDSDNWETFWWDGAQPPTLSNGIMALAGSGQLYTPASKNSPEMEAYIQKNLTPGARPTMHSFVEVLQSGVYGLQAKLMIPSGSPVQTGIGMSFAKFNDDGTRYSFEFELAYWDTNNQMLEMEFDYLTSGQQEKFATYRYGEFDTYYEISLVDRDNKKSIYLGDELIFEFNATWVPNFIYFYGFNDQNTPLKPFVTYAKDIKVLVPGTPNPVPTTPYTPDWFFVPNQGWLWTTRATYPYFFDNSSKAWMYFQTGNEKPYFYHYGTKKWMNLE